LTGKNEGKFAVDIGLSACSGRGKSLKQLGYGGSSDSEAVGMMRAAAGGGVGDVGELEVGVSFDVGAQSFDLGVEGLLGVR